MLHKIAQFSMLAARIDLSPQVFDFAEGTWILKETH